MKVDKLIRNTLLSLGALFVLIIAFIFFMFDASNKFADEHSAFIESYLTDFSVNWSTADVHSRTTNQLLSKMNEANARATIARFNVLGKLQRIEDLKIMNYFTGTSEVTGQIHLKAYYEGGLSLVKIVIIVNDDKVQVGGLHIKPIKELIPIVKVNEV